MPGTLKLARSTGIDTLASHYFLTPTCCSFGDNPFLFGRSLQGVSTYLVLFGSVL